uniref:PDZ domain-containing protein n=1 Tax=Meloidogyne hapla TaxID=6305 RepID=A0A1I8BIT7_MELHA
ASQGGFGIAISGSNEKEQTSNCGIFISDVLNNGPASGLLQIGDRITSCNGYPLEHADYSSAIKVMKEAQQLNMIVKRRVPVPFVEFEQRTLKFTLSKSRKKDDFGIVLGCKFYIKEILNPKLAEKEPGLKEGDSVLRINGQSLDGVSLEEATRLLQRSREKLSLVVQRDVRRGSNGGGTSNRWPSQTTVYERLGSVQATPRQSPTPAHYGFAPPNVSEGQYMSQGGIGRKGSTTSSGADYSPASGYKRYSDPMSSSLRTEFIQNNNQNGNVYSYPPPQGSVYPSSTPQKQQTFIQMQNNGKPINTTITTNNEQSDSSPYLQHNQHSIQNPSPHPQHRYLNNNNSVPSIRAQSLTPSSVQSLPVGGGGSNILMNHNSLQRPNFTPPIEQHNQQQLMAHQIVCQRYGNPRPIPNNQTTKQQRPQAIRTVAFQKGPSGLGIRVIGGNQVGIFISAVQEQSPADQHGIRVGDRIHAVNSVSIAGLTREEAFDILLSLGEQQISLAVEHAPEEFAQVKAGKFGDSFYVRSHFTYNRSTSRGAQQPGSQQPIELSIRAGDIFHVTDTLFGGSLGYWQATKIYSAEQQNSSSSESTASCTPATTNTGIIPHAKAAEQLFKIYRQTNNATNGNNTNDQGSNGGTLGRSLFRKKLSFSSRKLFGGGGSNNGGTTSDNLDEVLSGAGSATNSFTEIVPPAYERVALKRPAFHRPVVLYGPLADVARQLLLSQSSMRFGAPLPSTSSITSGTGADPILSSLSVSPTPERGSSNVLGGIRLCAVDAVMASQKHCVLCVSPASVERLQLAQYAPIVVLIDVESRSRVRDLRAKAGVTTQTARKLVEQAQKLKRQYSHLLTATLGSKFNNYFNNCKNISADATKEDQWFEALKALIFHLQERRVWMPEFQLDQPLDEMLLLPMQPPGDTPTSDGDKSDYGIYDPQQQQQQPLIINGSYYKSNNSGVETPYVLQNPAYSLSVKGQLQQNQAMLTSQGSEKQLRGQQQMSSSCISSAQLDSSITSNHSNPINSSRNSPFPQSQPLALYNINNQQANEMNNSINLRQ